MDRSRRLSLIVGGFVVAVAAVLAVVVLTLSSQSGFWKPRYRLVTFFENVQGLMSGAPVRLAGKDVGTVEHVSFGSIVGDRPPVRVVLLLEEATQDRIRTDSAATIDTIGLLGDKYVEITMGSIEGRPLADGEEIASVSPMNLNAALAVGTEALESISRLAANVNEVVEEFDQLMGGRRIAQAIQGVSEIIEEVQGGDGLLHELVYAEYEGSTFAGVERSLAVVEGILKEIRDGQGVLHTLIYEPTAEQDLVLNAVEAMGRLNRILEKVDAGEGTLGLLLNDPSLYDDVKQLLGGAQESLVVRSLIRLSTDDEE